MYLGSPCPFAFVHWTLDVSGHSLFGQKIFQADLGVTILVHIDLDMDRPWTMCPIDIPRRKSCWCCQDPDTRSKLQSFHHITIFILVRLTTFNDYQPVIWFLLLLFHQMDTQSSTTTVFEVFTLKCIIQFLIFIKKSGVIPAKGSQTRDAYKI